MASNRQSMLLTYPVLPTVREPPPRANISKRRSQISGLIATPPRPSHSQRAHAIFTPDNTRPQPVATSEPPRSRYRHTTDDSTTSPGGTAWTLSAGSRGHQEAAHTSLETQKLTNEPFNDGLRQYGDTRSSASSRLPRLTSETSVNARPRPSAPTETPTRSPFSRFCKRRADVVEDIGHDTHGDIINPSTPDRNEACKEKEESDCLTPLSPNVVIRRKPTRSKSRTNDSYCEEADELM